MAAVKNNLEIIKTLLAKPNIDINMPYEIFNSSILIQFKINCF